MGTKVDDIVPGSRSGRLSAVGLVRYKTTTKTGKRTYYNAVFCKCDCGKYCEILSSAFNNGTSSCGCYQREHMGLVARKYHNLSSARQGQRYSVYKAGAKKRGLEFNLTEAEFEQLTGGTCRYCKSTTARSEIGIDRIDSDLGYFMDNCQPCCRICNWMKRDLTHEEFLSHIELIHSSK